MTEVPSQMEEDLRFYPIVIPDLKNNKHLNYCYSIMKEVIEGFIVVGYTGILGILYLVKFLGINYHENMFYKWDKYMESKDRKRVIKERNSSGSNDDYLIRYYIFLKGSSGGRVRQSPFNIFIHKFLKSDEAVLHDHPWSYCSIILKGGYKEHMAEPCYAFPENNLEKVEIRKPGTLIINDYTHKHFVELIEDTCWTIFIPWKKKSDKWGFYPNLLKNKFEEQDNLFIEYDQYLVNNKND